MKGHKLIMNNIQVNLATVAIGKPERQVRKASHCGSNQQ